MFLRHTLFVSHAVPEAGSRPSAVHVPTESVPGNWPMPVALSPMQTVEPGTHCATHM